MKPYRPSSRLTASGVFLLILSLVGGVLIGTLAHAASRHSYVAFATAVAMAVAGAVLQRYVIRAAHVRDGRTATLYAVLLGMVIYGAYQFVGYSDFGTQSARALQASERADAATASRTLDRLLREEAGAPGILGYLRLRADHGEVHSIVFVNGSGAVRPSSDFSLGSSEVWLYWLAEAGIVLAGMAWSARRNAARPFCESGPGWYDSSPQLVGAAAGEAQQPLLGALEVGDVATAAELMQDEGGVPHPRLEVYAQRCPGLPAADVLLTLKQTTLDERGLVIRRRLLRGEITAERYAALTGAEASS